MSLTPPRLYLTQEEYTRYSCLVSVMYLLYERQGSPTPEWDAYDLITFAQYVERGEWGPDAYIDSVWEKMNNIFLMEAHDQLKNQENEG